MSKVKNTPATLTIKIERQVSSHSVTLNYQPMRFSAEARQLDDSVDFFCAVCTKGSLIGSPNYIQFELKKDDLFNAEVFSQKFRLVDDNRIAFCIVSVERLGKLKDAKNTFEQLGIDLDKLAVAVSENDKFVYILSEVGNVAEMKYLSHRNEPNQCLEKVEHIQGKMFDLVLSTTAIVPIGFSDSGTQVAHYNTINGELYGPIRHFATHESLQPVYELMNYLDTLKTGDLIGITVSGFGLKCILKSPEAMSKLHKWGSEIFDQDQLNEQSLWIFLFIKDQRVIREEYRINSEAKQSLNDPLDVISVEVKPDHNHFEVRRNEETVVNHLLFLQGENLLRQEALLVCVFDKEKFYGGKPVWKFFPISRSTGILKECKNFLNFLETHAEKGSTVVIIGYTDMRFLAGNDPNLRTKLRQVFRHLGGQIADSMMLREGQKAQPQAYALISTLGSEHTPAKEYAFVDQIDTTACCAGLTQKNEIKLESVGWYNDQDKGYAQVWINNRPCLEEKVAQQRGIHVCVLAEDRSKLLSHRCFDTHDDKDNYRQAKEFVEYVNKLSPGDWVIVLTVDEFSRGIPTEEEAEEKVRKAFLRLGGEKAGYIVYGRLNDRTEKPTSKIEESKSFRSSYLLFSRIGYSTPAYYENWQIKPEKEANTTRAYLSFSCLIDKNYHVSGPTKIDLYSQDDYDYYYRNRNCWGQLWINYQPYFSKLTSKLRGVHVCVLNTAGDGVLEHRCFDTHDNTHFYRQAKLLTNYLDELPLGTMVALFTVDEFSRGLNRSVQEAFERFGSKEIGAILDERYQKRHENEEPNHKAEKGTAYRSAYALISYAGASKPLAEKWLKKPNEKDDAKVELSCSYSYDGRGVFIQPKLQKTEYVTEIKLQSEGHSGVYGTGNGQLYFKGQGYFSKETSKLRGIHICVLDVEDQRVLKHRRFDTHDYSNNCQQAKELAKYLLDEKELPPGTIIALFTVDEFCQGLDDSVQEAFERFGSQKISHILGGMRGSWLDKNNVSTEFLEAVKHNMLQYGNTVTESIAYRSAYALISYAGATKPLAEEWKMKLDEQRPAKISLLYSYTNKFNEIELQSEGFFDLYEPGAGQLWLNGEPYCDEKISKLRGVHVCVLDSRGERVLEHRHFDTHNDSNNCQQAKLLAKYLLDEKELPFGTMIALFTVDEFCRGLNSSVNKAFKRFGSRKIEYILSYGLREKLIAKDDKFFQGQNINEVEESVSYRSAYALISYAGATEPLAEKWVKKLNKQIPAKVSLLYLHKYKEHIEPKPQKTALETKKEKKEKIELYQRNESKNQCWIIDIGEKSHKLKADKKEQAQLFIYAYAFNLSDGSPFGKIELEKAPLDNLKAFNEWYEKLPSEELLALFIDGVDPLSQEALSLGFFQQHSSPVLGNARFSEEQSKRFCLNGVFLGQKSSLRIAEAWILQPVRREKELSLEKPLILGRNTVCQGHYDDSLRFVANQELPLVLTENLAPNDSVVLYPYQNKMTLIERFYPDRSFRLKLFAENQAVSLRLDDDQKPLWASNEAGLHFVTFDDQNVRYQRGTSFGLKTSESSLVEFLDKYTRSDCLIILLGVGDFHSLLTLPVCEKLHQLRATKLAQFGVQKTQSKIWVNQSKFYVFAGRPMRFGLDALEILSDDPIQAEFQDNPANFSLQKGEETCDLGVNISPQSSPRCFDVTRNGHSLLTYTDTTYNGVNTVVFEPHTLQPIETRRFNFAYSIKINSAIYPKSGAFISVSGKPHGVKNQQKRGLHLVTFDQFTGEMLSYKVYDTHSSYEETKKFIQDLNKLEKGTYVALASVDEFTSSLLDSNNKEVSRQQLWQALSRLGVDEKLWGPLLDNLVQGKRDYYRSQFACISYIGEPENSKYNILKKINEEEKYAVCERVVGQHDLRKFHDYINHLPLGTVVAVGITGKNETSGLGSQYSLEHTLSLLGSSAKKEITIHSNRYFHHYDDYVLLGMKGARPGTALESSATGNTHVGVKMCLPMRPYLKGTHLEFYLAVYEEKARFVHSDTVRKPRGFDPNKQSRIICNGQEIKVSDTQGSFLQIAIFSQQGRLIEQFLLKDGPEVKQVLQHTFRELDPRYYIAMVGGGDMEVLAEKLKEIFPSLETKRSCRSGSKSCVITLLYHDSRIVAHHIGFDELSEEFVSSCLTYQGPSLQTTIDHENSLQVASGPSPYIKMNGTLVKQEDQELLSDLSDELVRRNQLLESGLYLIVFDPTTKNGNQNPGELIVCQQKRDFESAAEKIQHLPHGALVLGLTLGKLDYQIIPLAFIEALSLVGSQHIGHLEKGQHWSFIGTKGATPGSVPESISSDGGNCTTLFIAPHLLPHAMRLFHIKPEDFNLIANIEKTQWEKITGFEEKLFNKIQTMKTQDKACETTLFSGKEIEFLNSLLSSSTKKQDLNQEIQIDTASRRRNLGAVMIEDTMEPVSKSGFTKSLVPVVGLFSGFTFSAAGLSSGIALFGGVALSEILIPVLCVGAIGYAYKSFSQPKYLLDSTDTNSNIELESHLEKQWNQTLDKPEIQVLTKDTGSNRPVLNSGGGKSKEKASYGTSSMQQQRKREDDDEGMEEKNPLDSSYNDGNPKKKEKKKIKVRIFKMRALFVDIIEKNINHNGENMNLYAGDSLNTHSQDLNKVLQILTDELNSLQISVAKQQKPEELHLIDYNVQIHNQKHQFLGDFILKLDEMIKPKETNYRFESFLKVYVELEKQQGYDIEIIKKEYSESVVFSLHSHGGKSLQGGYLVYIMERKIQLPSFILRFKLNKVNKDCNSLLLSEACYSGKIFHYEKPTLKQYYKLLASNNDIAVRKQVIAFDDNKSPIILKGEYNMNALMIQGLIENFTFIPGHKLDDDLLDRFTIAVRQIYSGSDSDFTVLFKKKMEENKESTKEIIEYIRKDIDEITIELFKIEMKIFQFNIKNSELLLKATLGPNEERFLNYVVEQKKLLVTKKNLLVSRRDREKKFLKNAAPGWLDRENLYVDNQENKRFLLPFDFKLLPKAEEMLNSMSMSMPIPKSQMEEISEKNVVRPQMQRIDKPEMEYHGQLPKRRILQQESTHQPPQESYYSRPVNQKVWKIDPYKRTFFPRGAKMYPIDPTDPTEFGNEFWNSLDNQNFQLVEVEESIKEESIKLSPYEPLEISHIDKLSDFDQWYSSDFLKKILTHKINDHDLLRPRKNHQFLCQGNNKADGTLPCHRYPNQRFVVAMGDVSDVGNEKHRFEDHEGKVNQDVSYGIDFLSLFGAGKDNVMVSVCEVLLSKPNLLNLNTNLIKNLFFTECRTNHGLEEQEIEKMALYQKLTQCETSVEIKELLITACKTAGHTTIFSEVLPVILEKDAKVQQARILLPLNKGNNHWVSLELALFYQPNEQQLKVIIFQHDPYGKGQCSFEEQQVLTHKLTSLLENELLPDLMPQNKISLEIIYQESVYEKRQQDALSCGPITVEDIVLLAQGNTLNERLFPIGTKDLREQHQLIINQLQQNNPETENQMNQTNQSNKQPFDEEALKNILTQNISIYFSIIEIYVEKNEVIDQKVRELLLPAIEEAKNQPGLFKEIALGQNLKGRKLIQSYLENYANDENNELPISFIKAAEYIRDHINNKLPTKVEEKKEEGDEDTSEEFSLIHSGSDGNRSQTRQNVVQEEKKQDEKEEVLNLN